MNKQVLGGPDGDYTWSFGLNSTLLVNNQQFERTRIEIRIVTSLLYSTDRLVNCSLGEELKEMRKQPFEIGRAHV